MNARATLLLLACGLVGCRAPVPPVSDISPYGVTRIEPPHTGSYGTADSYYQPPATGTKPPVSARGDATPTPTTNHVAGAKSSGNESDLAWRSPTARSAEHDTGAPVQRIGATIGGASAGDRAARTVSHDEPVAADDGAYTPGSTLSLIPATPAASQRDAIELGGMPVNDATNLREPATFTPQGNVRDISELPEPPESVRTRIRTAGAPQFPAPSAGTKSFTPAADSGWRLR